MSEGFKVPAPATFDAFRQIRPDLDLSGKVYQLSQFQSSVGGFSDVFTAYLKDESGEDVKVAVKVLRANIKREKTLEKELVKELYIWSKLNHPRILRLEGFFLEGANFPYLVSRWLPGGNVLDYLSIHHEVDIMRLVLDIAKGIQYLHMNDIVHSDVKPENILISESGEPVLIDFGLSRKLAESQTMQFSASAADMKGTCRYMAKELLQGDCKTSKASDVWASGMTVYVLLTGNVPYSGLNNIQVQIKILNGETPSRPHDLDQWHVQKQLLWYMCNLCWLDSLPRPSISRIISGLELSYEKLGSEDRRPLHYYEACYEAAWCLIPPVSNIKMLRPTLQDIIRDDPSGNVFRCFFPNGRRINEVTLALAKTVPPNLNDDATPEYFASVGGRDFIIPGKYKSNALEPFCIANQNDEVPVEQGNRFSVLVFVPELMELVPASRGIIPYGRIPIHGGISEDGEVLYHAAGHPNGFRRVGHTAPHIGGAIFGYAHQSYFFKDSYEILCWRQ